MPTGARASLIYAHAGAPIAQLPVVMDDAKLVLYSLLLAAALLGATAFTAEIEYIGPDKQKQLEDLFEKSGYSEPKDTHSLKDAKWSCDMYGVRTHLQVQHALKLYKFSPDAKSTGWHNDGAQLVADYKAAPGALVGMHEKFEDQVKLTAEGRLISRLSVISPQKIVVAYSLCDSQ